MKELDDFLSLPNVEGMTTKVYVSKRLGEFEVGALSSDEYNRTMKRYRKLGKKGKIEFDTNGFNLEIISMKLINPDFSNAEFLKKAKCIDAKEFLGQKLLPGEIQELSDKILQFSGFDVEEENLDDNIEEAKN